MPALCHIAYFAALSNPHSAFGSPDRAAIAAGFSQRIADKIGYHSRMKFSLLLLMMAVSLLAVAVPAQKADTPLPLAKLEAPVSVTFKTADLEWLRYGGTIAASVLVDKKGKITIGDLTGPVAPCDDLSSEHLVALRTAAMEAVQKAKVEPATDADGNPVKSGVLINIKVPQTEPANPPATDQLPLRAKAINAGVINGKAISLARPEYPPEAHASHASGAVSVETHVDETGKVTYAGAISGNPLLRYAAVNAACHSKFSPILLGGQPIKLTGIITYNFVP